MQTQKFIPAIPLVGLPDLAIKESLLGTAYAIPTTDLAASLQVSGFGLNKEHEGLTIRDKSIALQIRINPNGGYFLVIAVCIGKKAIPILLLESSSPDFNGVQKAYWLNQNGTIAWNYFNLPNCPLL